MLPHLSAIPIQNSEASADASRNINRTFPVGQNVSATVVAVSRDQVQPEIFRLNLEVNNRLIQMGVFQPLPVGQTINVNRQSDGKIQITLPPTTKGQEKANTTQQPSAKDQPVTQGNIKANRTDTILKIQIPNPEIVSKLPVETSIKAAVISSRAVYAQTSQPLQTPTTTVKPGNFATQGTAIQSAPATGNPASSPSPASPAPTASTAATPIASQQPTSPATNIGNTNTTPSALQNSAPPTTQPSQTTADSTAKISTTAQPIAQSTQPANNQKTAPSTLLQPSNTTTANTPSTPERPVTTAQAATNTNVAAPIRPTGPATHHVINLAMPDGSKIEINSPRPLPQGAEIQLTRSANGEVHINRIQNPPLNPSSALERPGIQEALRDALPRQIPTAEALNQLSQLTSRAETPQMAQLSNAVRSMLQLFGIQPGSTESAAQIRQNVELGGMTTERMLSRGFAPPNDLKNQLKQLEKLSDNLPAEQRERMEQLLKGIHSRVTSQQLNSLQQWKELPDGGFERVLQLDLPIKQGSSWENLELRLSREGGTNAAGELVSVWRVRLHFDLEERGGLDAEIRLTDDHEIRTLFWCEQPETAKILQERAEEFAGRLRQCGFSNSEVDWHDGIAPEQSSPIHKQLIDLHT